MRKGKRAGQESARRSVFGELMAGVRDMAEHRGGKLTLRTHDVPTVTLPAVNAATIRATREALRMSRGVFARKLRVKERTLERWEQGRSIPNDQAVALILLVRAFPDTLERLETIAPSA